VGRETIDRPHCDPGYATVRGNMSVATASEIMLPPDYYYWLYEIETVGRVAQSV
jgi:hypothetical protein